MKNIAIYAGTFDPITYGHTDLIERAAHIFDKVIVAVAESARKQPLFSLIERIELAKVALVGQNNIEILGFDSLLIDFAKRHQANVIIRGLRAVADFDYEFQLATMNRFMNPDIETLFLMPAEKYMYVSSSMVREIAMLQGDVTGFVPACVNDVLIKKFAIK